MITPFASDERATIESEEAQGREREISPQRPAGKRCERSHCPQTPLRAVGPREIRFRFAKRIHREPIGAR